MSERSLYLTPNTAGKCTKANVSRDMLWGLGISGKFLLARWACGGYLGIIYTEQLESSCVVVVATNFYLRENIK